MEVKLEYKKTSYDIESDWLANHTLSKEQVAKLIRNKIERARIYQKQNERKFHFD